MDGAKTFIECFVYFGFYSVWEPAEQMRMKILSYGFNKLIVLFESMGDFRYLLIKIGSDGIKVVYVFHKIWCW